jgi:hypothetical protein
MKISVNKTIEIDGKLQINFVSKIGEGLAIWKNEQVPNLGFTYDVEFNIEQLVEKQVNAFSSTEKEPFLKLVENTMCLNGFIDSIDEDGVAYFRLASDCLVMIEVNPENIKQGEWLVIKCDSETLEVYSQ